MAAMLQAIYRNKTQPPSDPDVDFTNKTVLITGANSGLGLEAAGKIAKRDAKRLILAVRNPEKGAAAQRLVQHLASDPTCTVEVWPLDMASYDSIASFVARMDAEVPRLDIALLNAGVFMNEYRASSYGWEESLQVNVLGTTYLALLLLPKLASSRSEAWTPVLEITGSGRHAVVALSDDAKDPQRSALHAYNLPDGFAGGLSYRTSKLFMQYAARELASLARPDASRDPAVLVITVCPGACQSNLSRGVRGVMVDMARVLANAVFLRTAEEGARTLVSGTQLGVRGHGQFWQHDVIQEPAKVLVGEEGQRMQAKVWKEIQDAIATDVSDFRDVVDRARKAVGTVS